MSDRDKHWKVSTKAIHIGEEVDGSTKASSPSIVPSVTYVPDEVKSFSPANRPDDEPPIYIRKSGPTVEQLEKKLASLEGGQKALAFASGMAAASALCLGRLSSGDHLIVSDTSYVGTAELFRFSLPRFGIDVSYIDLSDPRQLKDAIRENTKMVWVETPANPTMKLTDVKAISQIAHEGGSVDVVVDSTFATPIGLNPLELGADFVLHSLTKYIGGHGDALGGAVIAKDYDALVKLNNEATVHYGAALSPFNAWLIMRGAGTLPIRMKAHEQNALKIAEHLEIHPKVERVFYPGLPSHPQHELARSQMKNFSGMMTFRTKEAGKQVAARMIEKFEIIHYAVSLGHLRSLIYYIDADEVNDSSFTLEGKQLESYREYMGEGVFRFSVGLEDPDDIINELNIVLG